MPHEHKPDCKCQIHQWMVELGISYEEAHAKREAWEQEMLEKYGWYAVGVEDDCESPTHFSYHTYGLERYDNHSNFQIVYPIGQLAHTLLIPLAEKVKAGGRFKNGDISNDVLEGYSVKLVTAAEGGRKVLRVILPDKEGNLEPHTITGKYGIQYADL